MKITAAIMFREVLWKGFTFYFLILIMGLFSVTLCIYQQSECSICEYIIIVLLTMSLFSRYCMVSARPDIDLRQPFLFQNRTIAGFVSHKETKYLIINFIIVSTILLF